MTAHKELGENAKELYLYATMNKGPMGQIEANYRHLERFKARGLYNSAAALRLIQYTVNSLAKAYAKEYSTSAKEWNTLFNVADRLAVASCLVRDFQTEYDAGNRYSSK